MALRNISNIAVLNQSDCHYSMSVLVPKPFARQHQYNYEQQRTAAFKKLHENKQIYSRKTVTNNSAAKHKQQNVEQRKITPSISSSSANTISSSTNSTSSSSSIRIRTSSPISSSDSSELSGPANAVISPAKFMNAHHHHHHHQQQQQQQQQQNHRHRSIANKPKLNPNYASLKHLAYEKLRRQQLQQQQQQQTGEQHADSSSTKLKSMGKLKLAVYRNLTHLTVHVVHGRSYKLVDAAEATYVRISVLPDEERSYANIRTKPVHASRHNDNDEYIRQQQQQKQQQQQQQQYFSYDSKFSFEIDQLSRFSNRLFISVWSSSKLEKLIGCFSLKVGHLLQSLQNEQQQHQQQQSASLSSKPKQVWYHLLPIKYGLTKHLKCQVSKKPVAKSRRRPSASIQYRGGAKNSPNQHPTHLNKDLIGLNRIQLVLEKCESEASYGFTVASNCPCIVGKVDLDRPAFRHGLRPGDFISKINGCNVSRATVESVVRAVRASGSRLLIEVHRQDRQLLLLEGIYEQQQQQPRRRSERRVASEAVEQQQQQQQQARSKSCGQLIAAPRSVVLNTVQSRPCFGLEAVPEEEEEEQEFQVGAGEAENDSVEDDEFDDDSDAEFDDEYEEEVEQKLAACSEENYEMHVNYDSIRFVDSSSSSELQAAHETDEPGAEEADQVEEIRRVTAQIYLGKNSTSNTSSSSSSNNNSPAYKQANIRCLNAKQLLIEKPTRIAEQQRRLTFVDFNQII